MKTKALSAILFLTILFSSVFCANGAAVNTEKSSAKKDVFASGASSVESMYPEAFEQLRQGLLEVSGKIYISDNTVPKAEYQNLYNAVLQTSPEIFYTDDAYSAHFSNGYITYYEPTYLDTKANILKLQERFDAAASEILYSAPEGLTDEQAVLFYHDYLIDCCQYDIDEKKSGYSYGAYGAFVNRKAVCQGYTLGLMYLLRERGIETLTVDSQSMNHMWLMVKINGKYYHLDATYDDTLPDTLGKVNHTNLLLSEAKIKESGSDNHYGFTAPQKATDTAYDNCFWTGVASKICYYNGYWYYFEKSTGKLLKRNYEKAKTATLYTVTDQWLVSKGSDYHYTDNFSKIAIKDGLIYFNTPMSVKTYNIETKAVSTVFTLQSEDDGYIYGLTERNGDIIFSVKGSPNDLDTNICSLNTSLAPDINGDGTISIKDVTLIQKHLVKLTALTSAQKEAADLNGDGAVTVKDGLILQKRLASYE